MQYSTNLNMNKPEKADQYNLDHWNQNTDILDSAIQNEINARELTDTNLQNVINGLGSASAKDVGSGNGNLPELSSAINSSAENTPIVADGNGKLKPHVSGALGTSAFLNAGANSGNVALVENTIGTFNAILLSGTNGIKQSSKYDINHLLKGARLTAVCSSAKSDQTKEISIDGLDALYEGLTIRVLFKNGNSVSNPKLNISGNFLTGNSSTFNEIYIKTIRAGSKITPINHNGKWRGASSFGNEMWQPNTWLELMYDGTDWVIIGNPVVEDYVSIDGNNGYRVYANGLIEQWQTYINSYAPSVTTCNLSINYSNTRYFVAVTEDNCEDTPNSISTRKGTALIVQNKTTSTFDVLHYEYYLSSQHIGVMCIGY